MAIRESYIESIRFLRLYLVAFTSVIATVHAAMFFIHSPFNQEAGRLAMAALGAGLGSLVLIFSIFNTREGKYDDNKTLLWFSILSGALLVLVFEPWKYFQEGKTGAGFFFMIIGPVAAVGEFLLNKVYHLKKAELAERRGDQPAYRCFCGYQTNDSQAMSGHVSQHNRKRSNHINKTIGKEVKL